MWIDDCICHGVIDVGRIINFVAQRRVESRYSGIARRRGDLERLVVVARVLQIGMKPPALGARGGQFGNSVVPSAVAATILPSRRPAGSKRYCSALRAAAILSA